MRKLKLMTLVLVLALTCVVYAAARVQDAAKTQEPANGAMSCCMKHKGEHDGAQAAAHAGAKHEGCCAGGCCGGGACSKEHKGQAQVAAHAGASCCKDGAACCMDGGECCKGHKHEAKQTAQKAFAEREENCCGASCACCGQKAERAARAGR